MPCGISVHWALDGILTEVETFFAMLMTITGPIFKENCPMEYL